MRLDVAPGGKLVIDGAVFKGAFGVGAWVGFTRDVVDLKGHGLAGLPRPSLLALDVSAPPVECASATAQPDSMRPTASTSIVRPASAESSSPVSWVISAGSGPEGFLESWLPLCPLRYG